MECHTTLERVVAQRAKEKMHEGLGFQTERGEQRKFGWILQLVLANRAQRSPVLVLRRVHEEQSISGPAAKKHS